MERGYVPIQPKERDVGDKPPGSVAPLRQPPKVACERCRRKKIRCDGTRPTCAGCESLAEECTYRMPSEASHDTSLEDRKVLVQVLHLMSNLSEARVMEVLGQLRGESDSMVILEVLKKAEQMEGACIDKDRRSELEIQNPKAYPMLPQDSLDEPGQVEFEQLAQSNEDKTPPPFRASQGEPSSHPGGESLCDRRLEKLDMKHWTSVSVGNDIAAQAISLYLEIDHPLLGFFEPDLFLSSLTNPDTAHCSSILVNALLYWATQMYSGMHVQADQYAIQFCTEAEQLWTTEKDLDSVLNVAAALFLSLGYMGHGRDHSVLQYLQLAADMATRLGLFSGQQDMVRGVDVSHMSSDVASQHLYAAWGAFNWVTHMSVFYRQPGSPYAIHPPRLPIPDGDPATADDERARSPKFVVLPRQSKFMGGAFPYICRFWRIMHDVSLAYNKQDLASGQDEDPRAFRFAEFKFRELLAWSGTLPQHLLRDEANSHCAQILHIWLHMGILEIFRPGMLQSSRYAPLKTFSSASTTAESVCVASVNQLKQLTTNFRFRHHSVSAYSLLWHTALIYLANSMLVSPKKKGWFFYFLLCVYGYKRLGRSWRVAKAISRALLSMALRKGDVSSATALQILKSLDQDEFSNAPGDIRATFMADLDLAQSDPAAATVESQAADFEWNKLMQDFIDNA